MFGFEPKENKVKLPTNIGKMKIHIELNDNRVFDIEFTGFEQGSVCHRASVALFVGQRAAMGLLILDDGEMVPVSSVKSIKYGPVEDYVKDV